jgi:hypothetical protein
VTAMMRMRASRPVKSAGLVVYSGRLSAIAVAAIIRGVARHGGELLPGDEPAALSPRDQLTDPMAIPGDHEGLPVFDRVHDLPRSCPASRAG